MKQTALSKYQRLEASGLWRADPEAQRIDVIVSVGEATLTITDLRERVLTHWSLAAIARANPGQRPAVYHPDGDPGETLELTTDEVEMIAAIEKLRSAIARQRPRPGRLRLFGVLVSLSAVLAWWFSGCPARRASTRCWSCPESSAWRSGKACWPNCNGPPDRPAVDRGGWRRLVLWHDGSRHGRGRCGLWWCAMV